MTLSRDIFSDERGVGGKGLRERILLWRNLSWEERISMFGALDFPALLKKLRN